MFLIKDLFVLRMASPILSKGKVRVSKIATFLGITVVSLSSFNFLALTSNQLGALMTLEVPISPNPGGCHISIVSRFPWIKFYLSCFLKWHFLNIPIPLCSYATKILKHIHTHSLTHTLKLCYKHSPILSSHRCITASPWNMARSWNNHNLDRV